MGEGRKESWLWRPWKICAAEPETDSPRASLSEHPEETPLLSLPGRAATQGGERGAELGVAHVESAWFHREQLKVAHQKLRSLLLSLIILTCFYPLGFPVPLPSSRGGSHGHLSESRAS